MFQRSCNQVKIDATKDKPNYNKNNLDYFCTKHCHTMKKQVITIAVMLSVCMPVFSQSAKDEISANNRLAAGKYFAYTAPETVLTPAPEGYEPFYVSSFARHGSRYLTDKEKYDEPRSILEDAENKGYLTEDGKRALEIIKYLSNEAEGRYGELTPKGAQQHRDLIKRMYNNFKPVFNDGVHVDARSTYKTRAFLSMAAACVELKGLNPKLEITTESSLHDSYYIKYKNPAYEKEHLANSDSVYHAADSVYIHPDRLMKQLFNNTSFINSIKDTKALMSQLFELNGISQSSYNAPDLSFLFTQDEVYDLWQRNNFEWYYEKGASPYSGGHMYYLERNLLKNFVTTADTVIASGKCGATLRFGHDTNLAPLAVLMGINNLSASTSDWQKIADTYRTYKIIPMCGNIQMILYRNSSNDIIAKVLLNEREVEFPINKFSGSYYKWEDLKKYWLDKTENIILPEQQE